MDWLGILLIFGMVVCFGIALAILTLPLWFKFFVSWASSKGHQFYNFWAKNKENAGLGLQTNEALTTMAIRLTEEHYELVSELYKGHLPFFKKGYKAAFGDVSGVTYEQYCTDPKQYLKEQYQYVAKDGIVWVGVPWNRYRTVREWAMTPNHRLALNIKPETAGYHTIPMTIQTTRFGMIGIDESDPEVAMTRKKYDERMAEVLNDQDKKLNKSEEWMLFVLDIPETADGFSIPTTLEIDWMVGDPWELQTKPGRDNVGILLLSHLNASLRKAMKGLNALEVTKATEEAGAKSAIQSKLEQAIWTDLGYNADGSSHGQWYEWIKNHEIHHSLAILARTGLLVLRVRVADVSLPKVLKEELQKPARARARMSNDLIAAEARRQVAEKDKATKKLAGEGEQAFAEAVAQGDRARVAAWSEDGKSVDAEAVAARLQSQGLETYGDAVKSSGSPVIVGTPGAPTDGASMLAGGLTQLGVGLGKQSKSGGGKSKKDKSKPESKESTEESDDEDDE